MRACISTLGFAAVLLEGQFLKLEQRLTILEELQATVTSVGGQDVVVHDTSK